MPPKRKNKGIKSSPVMALRTLRTPDAARNKVSDASKLGQARRSDLVATSGRSSRLLPSVPFQMTTRRGAKTASAAPSSASSGSRRSSLNDVAQFQEAPSDFEDERPAKRSRPSTDSGSPQLSNGSFDNKTPMNGSQTPELHNSAPGATSMAAVPKTAGKKRRASDDSTRSSNTINPRHNGLLTRTQSELSEQQLPRRKKRKTTGTPADSADQPPELTDASTAPNSPEQLPEVDGSQSLQNVLPTNGDAPAKPGRRLPGRRRQPHSDINIETDLRRQLNLKMSYRSLAKVQKSLLEELSNRTINNLKDKNYHEKCPEYEPLMHQLQERRDSRVDQIHAVRTYRLEQAERVLAAEERIQKEQYINRFRDLQDDFLLQCYYRMKQIEREMKGEQADATDDEENVLPPTYTDEPHHDVEDRIGSKYASRSRAYVEADKELEDDSLRRRFDKARAAFVAKEDEADDSIDDLTGGFARFAGPDRDEAIAHYNITSMVDAAMELDRTPTPRPEAPMVQIIPNAQALDLMMLAEMSEQHAQSKNMQQVSTSYEQSKPEPQPDRVASPATKQEFNRKMSPTNAPTSIPLSLQATHSSPVKTDQVEAQPIQEVPRPEPNAHVEAPKNTTPARVSTHRIMDMLNSDTEVPVFRSRESQVPPQEPNTPSRREATINQHNTPSQNFVSLADTTNEAAEQPVDQALMDALGGRPSEPPSPVPPKPQPWPRQTALPPRDSEEAPRRRDPRDPLQKIRELLDRKAREHGREPLDRSNHGKGPLTLPHMYNVQPAQERQEVAGYDPNRPSAGLYSAPPSVPPSYSPSIRRGSQDQGPGHWDSGRRMSGSQAPQQPNQSPYNDPSQPHRGEHSRTAASPPTLPSTYAFPPGPLPLPQKPHGPPVNFRFAHYDPVPSRPSYPPQSPTYSSTSHAPQLAPPPPPYAASYPPSYQSGYVPPPGSFQAPPPASNIPPYPPLKIHQYGGQPILPANMAPPPHTGPPMTFVGQQTQPPVFSPPQTQPPRLQYEQRDTQSSERPPEPQSRPRRPYRSYHAPGTQFRSYQPSERRRG